MIDHADAAGRSRGFLRRWAMLILVAAVSSGCSPAEGPPPIEPSVFTVEWERTFGETGRNSGYSVQQTADGGLIIAGQSAPGGTGDGDLYLLELDQAGDKRWERFYGGSDRAGGYHAQQTPDGGYIAAGQITAEGESSSNAYLVKTNHEGELEWEGSFGGAGNECALFVGPSDEGGYIAAGWTESFGGRRELYLLKVDINGQRQWEGNFGRGSRSTGNHVLETADGGFLAAGGIESTAEEGYGERDIYLVKVDAAGQLQWDLVLGGSGDEVGFFVQPDGEGGYVAAGQSFSYASGTTSVYLAGVDEAGKKKWEKYIDSNESYLGLSVHPALEGGYLILGQVMDTAGYRGISLARADREGEKEWVIYLSGGRNSAALAAVQVDEESYVVVGWTEEKDDGNRAVYLTKIRP